MIWLSLPFFLAFLRIFKYFFPNIGCYAFDFSDDANHTFVNLHVAKDILMKGKLPLINIYNNFGTPFVGDSISCPFAVHALTQYILPGPLAMTANRFFAVFFTFIILKIYFQKWVPSLSANIAAFLVCSASGLLWHLAHHHYQFCIFFAVLALMCQENFAKKPSLGRFFLYFGSLVLIVWNTNINVSLIVLAFVVGNEALSARFNGRRFLLTLAATLLAFFVYYPDTFYFWELTRLSTRSLEGYGPEVPYTLSELIAGFTGKIPHAWPYCPIPTFIFLTLALLGTEILWRDPKRRPLAIKVIGLGFLPILIVLGLLYFRKLAWSLPLIRSTDVTRLFWISNVFLAVPAGFAINAIRTRTPFSKPVIAACGIFCVVSAYLHLDLLHPLTAVALVLFFLALGSSLKTKFATVMMVLTLIVGTSDELQRVLGVNNLSYCAHRYARFEESLFQPQALVKHLEPFSRIATNTSSHWGHDLKIIQQGFFGSNGRSVLLNQAFTDYLGKNHLVKIDQHPIAYHFSPPWQTQKLSRLGIRYLFLGDKDLELESQGWKLLGKQNGELHYPLSPTHSEVHLYENPYKPQPAYLLDHAFQMKVATLSDIGNGIAVRFEPANHERELVFTQIQRRGWTAKVQGKPRAFTSKDDLFLHLPILEGESFAEVEFKPYGWTDFMLGIFFTCSLIAILFLLVGKRLPNYIEPV